MGVPLYHPFQRDIPIWLLVASAVHFGIAGVLHPSSNATKRPNPAGLIWVFTKPRGMNHITTTYMEVSNPWGYPKRYHPFRTMLFSTT